MANNPVTAALRAKSPIAGAFCGIPASFSAELVAAAGFDYVCVDLQHGLADFGDLAPMFAAIAGRGAAPLARVPANEPWVIMKALDLGAMGVIVPLVDSRADAERAVAACRYPNAGGRSFGPVRSAVAMGSRERADVEDVACIVMIETADGLKNAAEIAATPGVDALYVGPADLSLALGLEPRFEHPEEPEHDAAIERIRLAAADGGIAAGIQCLDGTAARRRREQGFCMTTVGSDHNWLRIAAAAEFAAVTGAS